MITGCGVDIVEVRRLKSAADRWGDVFLRRVFTQRELAYSKAKRFPFQHLAARFAAKEAVYKAFGKQSSLNFRDIEIYHDRFGKPCCRIKNKMSPVLVSMSHSHEYAVASAILPKKARLP